MYYNHNDQIIINKLPKNFLKSDGTMLSDFHLNNIDVLSDYGFFIVRNDNNIPPTPNSIESVKDRQISLSKPYCDISRTWINIAMPIIPPPTVPNY